MVHFTSTHLFPVKNILPNLHLQRTGPSILIEIGAFFYKVLWDSAAHQLDRPKFACTWLPKS